MIVLEIAIVNRLRTEEVHRMPKEAKLGKPSNRTAIVPLHFVKRNGGLVPRTVVLLQRKYPAVYLRHGHNQAMTPKAHAETLQGLESRLAEVCCSRTFFPPQLLVSKEIFHTVKYTTLCCSYHPGLKRMTATD